MLMTNLKGTTHFSRGGPILEKHSRLKESPKTTVLYTAQGALVSSVASTDRCKISISRA